MINRSQAELMRAVRADLKAIVRALRARRVAVAANDDDTTVQHDLTIMLADNTVPPDDALRSSIRRGTLYTWTEYGIELQTVHAWTDDSLRAAAMARGFDLVERGKPETLAETVDRTAEDDR